MAIIMLQGESERLRGIHYEIDNAQQPIGVGGMGQVCKGLMVDEHTGSTRPVAIKFMFDDLPPQALERARREANIQLRNDNLVEMLGFMETQETDPTGVVKKHYHVVSELLDGVSLSDLLNGKTANRDGHDVPFAVKLLQDYRNDPDHFARTVVMSVLSGLMALHDAGYIHRDIDPSNIFVTAEGHIKLIDFGIAKQMNALTTSDKSLTVAGKFMGKPEYASPELALGDLQHQNQTTDIYAVGILLYQCIVGHTPFEGPRHEILEKQIKEKLPLGVIKNKDLRRIIATACEKKQELRYQSSAQMRVALEEMGGVKKAMSARQKGIIVSAAAAAVLVLAIIAFVVHYRSSQSKQQAEQAELSQQEAEFSKEKNAFEAEINDVILRAQHRMEAVSVEIDDITYEHPFMDAYNELDSIEKVVKGNKVYRADFPEIARLKKTAIDALNSAMVQLKEQANALRSLDETTADSYDKRVKSIEDFINKKQ